jgi:glucosyl-dolichyl phosphate glucuronosyltransferase
MNQIRLDVIVPTYNRAALLAPMLDSLLAADRSDNLDVRVTVVDNRSSDNTRAVVEAYTRWFAGGLNYVFEFQQGRSRALNAGIAATHGELVAMIDDDEEVDTGWFVAIGRAFEDPMTDFIGGPYVPRWGGERPDWLGTGYGAVIGSTSSGSTVHRFGCECGAMLMGGNAVIRRSILDRVGPYSEDLGRTADGRLLSCEDRDMYARLLAIGATGYYRPDLIIYHYVPPERLTKRYFRRWCLWHGVSQGVLDRRQPESVPYLFGIPRYKIGAATRGTIRSLRSAFDSVDPARAFDAELAWWDLIGFAYGKHLFGRPRIAVQSGPPAQARVTQPSALANCAQADAAPSSNRSAVPGR